MLCNSSGTRSGIKTYNSTVQTHLILCNFLYNASNGSNSAGLQTHENTLNSIWIHLCTKYFFSNRDEKQLTMRVRDKNSILRA